MVGMGWGTGVWCYKALYAFHTSEAKRFLFRLIFCCLKAGCTTLNMGNSSDSVKWPFRYGIQGFTCVRLIILTKYFTHNSYFTQNDGNKNKNICTRVYFDAVLFLYCQEKYSLFRTTNVKGYRLNVIILYISGIRLSRVKKFIGSIWRQNNLLTATARPVKLHTPFWSW